MITWNTAYGCEGQLYLDWLVVLWPRSGHDGKCIREEPQVKVLWSETEEVPRPSEFPQGLQDKYYFRKQYSNFDYFPNFWDYFYPFSIG